MSDGRKDARGSYKQGDEPVDYRMAVYAWLYVVNILRDYDVLGNNINAVCFLHSVACISWCTTIWSIMSKRDMWHVTQRSE